MKRRTLQDQLNSEKSRLIAVAASGIFSSLPFFFENLFLSEWVSLIPFFCVLLSSAEYGKRKAFRYGFLFHLCLSIPVLSWFRELLSMSAIAYPKALMVAVVAAAVLLISALQSVIFGFAALLSRRVIKKPRFAAADMLLCALLFTVAEIILSFGRFGFPWVVLYLSQRAFLGGIQTASLFGGHFLSFCIVLCNLLAAKGILSLADAPKKSISRFTAFGAALLVFLSNLGVSLFLMIPHRNAEKSIDAAVYQDNHSSYEKWNGSSLSVCEEFIDAFRVTYSVDDAPEIVLLSETVFTETLACADAYESSIGVQIEQKLCALTKEYPTTVVCGAFYEKDGKQYNAQFLFENGRRSDEVYQKRTLVPFGEYMPYERFLNRIFPSLRDINLSGTSLTPGIEAAVFHSSKANFGGLICYDSIFYQNARKSAKNKADFLLLSTNDSWYNDSAAIDQHYGHAVFRAIENRKGIVRAAATGRSGLIDAYGKSLDKSALFTRCFLRSPLLTSTEETLFTRFGYGYTWLLLVLCLLTRTFFFFRERKGERA